MIDYKLEIEVFDNENNGIINNVTVDEPVEGSFQGGAYQNSAIETISNGANPFIVGQSKVGDGSYFADNYNGALSYIKSDINGDITPSYKIVISGENIHSFVINFDNITNEFATQIKINNTLIYNDDTLFVYKLEEPTNRLDIEFLKWNLPNRYIRYTSIRVDLKLTYNQFTGLLEFTRGSQSTQNSGYPQYGLTSQYGSCKILDNNGELSELELLQILNKNIKFKFYMDNELIGTYVYKEIDKEEKTNIYNVKLQDIAINFNDIIINNKINIKEYKIRPSDFIIEII